MAAARFRGSSGPTGPQASALPGEDGATQVTLADSGWIYTTNLPLADLHIHLLLPRTLLCLPEAPAAKRQGLFLLFFLSIWLVTEIKEKRKTQSWAPWEKTTDDN